ncbi:MAG: helix-turn-helix domain-containing protein [Candidatus Micrarchaeia archaeon]
MKDLEVQIAGEIACSETPGGTMKKWREIFGITQADLGKVLGISASTISDYEGNRRRSPGTGVIKRFVGSIVEIDKERGGHVIDKLTRPEEKAEQFFEVHEFATSIGAIDFAKMINGKVVANEDLMKVKKIYGYTVIDSLKVIMEMPYTHYPRLYGSMSERAFIFTKVSTGRSPLVVVRVTAMKPSIIVLHGLDADKIDELALKLAEKEQIPVITTKMDVSKIKDSLNKI